MNRLLPFIAFFFIYILFEGSISAQQYPVAKVFTRLDDALANPNEVEILNLTRQKLKLVPAEIFDLPKLRELYLDKNQIAEIPSEINRLTKLEKLSLQHNDFERFPDALLDVRTLEFLDLADNMIDTIPDEIYHLQKLHTLSIWDNPIAYYSPALSKLPQLKILDLLHNTMSRETQSRLYNDLPNCKLIVSPPCACMDGD